MGKHWTKEERAYFIDVVIPLSKYSTGVFTDNGAAFADLTQMMQDDLDNVNQSRRIYTGDNLFQHWYQKVRPGALSHDNSAIYAPSLPGSGRHPNHNGAPPLLGPYQSSSPAQTPTPASGGYGSDDEEIASEIEDVGPEQRFTFASSEDASSHDASIGASRLLPPQTTTDVVASSSTQLHLTKTNNQTTSSTMTDNNNISSDMAPSAPQVTFGEEDNSSKKRVLLPSGEVDDIFSSTQIAAKKLKFNNPSDLNLKKATGPELGSDEPSPTPPAAKKAKGRVSKTSALNLQAVDNPGRGDDKPRGGTSRGRPGAMFSSGGVRGGIRGGGQVHGGGHHGRHLCEPSVAYGDEEEEDDEDFGDYAYPPGVFHGVPRPHDQQEYGMAGGRQFDRYSYGELAPPRAPYANAYGGLMPRYHSDNLSFQQHPDFRQGPNNYYPPNRIAQDPRAWVPSNAAVFGPNHRPDATAAASRQSIVRPHDPSTAVQRPTSSASQHPSRSTSTRQMSPHRPDVPAHTERPISRQSNAPTFADPNNPVDPNIPVEGEEAGPRRQGKIYVAGGAEVMVETCPCCRRGF